MKKIFFLLLFAALFFTFNFKAALAADLNIVCDDSGCIPPTNPSIFSSGLWFPLKSETRSIYLRNDSPTPQLIALSVTNGTTGTTDLSNVMHMKIVDDHSNTPFDNSFTNFYTLNEFPLTLLLNSGHDVIYSFTASMDNVGNDWQEKETSFDMTLGFSVIPTQTSTPTPTPNPEPTATSTPGPSPTPTPQPADTPTPTPTPVAGTYISYYYGGEYIQVPVLGAETSSTPTPTIKIVEGAAAKKGKTLGACMNPWWWWLLYLVQIVFQIIMRRVGRPQNRRLVLSAQVLSGLLCGFIFWKFFCHWIFWVISALMSLFFLYVTHRKTRQEE